MNGEKGVKAAFDFLYAMRKIETMAPTTQEELDAIKDGILNMACIPDEPEGLYMVETAELPDEHRYGEDALKILYHEEQAKRSDAEQDTVNQINAGFFGGQLFMKIQWLYDDARDFDGKQCSSEFVDKLVQTGQEAVKGNHILPCYVESRLAGKVTDIWREGNEAFAHVELKPWANDEINEYDCKPAFRAMRHGSQSYDDLGDIERLKLIGIDFWKYPAIDGTKIVSESSVGKIEE
jgi:hypothetical protein